MTILSDLNINTTAQLIDWTCNGEVDGQPVDFVPYCPFPYTNAGWDTVVSGNPNITMNDCSMKFGEALGTGYLIKCTIYGLANLICFFFSVKFLLIYIEKRHAMKAKNRNLNERLCLINMTIIFCHFIFCMDLDSFNFVNYTVSSVLKGYCSSMFIVLGFILITSWVTIVDSGKSKKTPVWCKNLRNISIFLSVAAEVVLAAVEIHVGEAAKSAGSYDGTVNGIKSCIFASLLLIWSGIALHYYRKINIMLAEGGGGLEKGKPNPNAVIKKFMAAIAFCFSIGIVYKFLFAFLRFGKVIHTPPPCSNGYIDIVSIIYLTIQIASLVAQNPAKLKKKKRGMMSTNVSSSSSVAPMDETEETG